MELLQTIVIAFVLAFLITTFVVQGFVIPTGSMETTIMPGDRVFANKFIYRFSEPERGDVIVFKYPLDPSKNYVKRVIGLPGDKLEIKNGVVYINDKVLSEPYVAYPSSDNFGPKVIGEDELFAMGDNRINSEDSRFWGTVPMENLRGEAFLTFWPLNRIGLLH